MTKYSISEKSTEFINAMVLSSNPLKKKHFCVFLNFLLSEIVVKISKCKETVKNVATCKTNNFNFQCIWLYNVKKTFKT